MRKRMLDQISFIFGAFSSKLKINAKNNILDDNVFSEFFIRDLFNLLYNTKYENANTGTINIEGIDLIDEESKIVMQVTSDKRKSKIDKTVGIVEEKYQGYRLKFMILTEECDSIKKHDYHLTNNYFDPKSDIINFTDVLSVIMDNTINIVKECYVLIKEELINFELYEENSTHVSQIIKLLSSNGGMESKEKKKSFKIESKIKHNKLKHSKLIIEKFRSAAVDIDTIYDIYDSQGKNSSKYVFAKVHSFYAESLRECESETMNTKSTFSYEDFVFESVIDKLTMYIKENRECLSIPPDELDYNIRIIVINAFFRCEIFENPEGYNYDNA